VPSTRGGLTLADLAEFNRRGISATVVTDRGLARPHSRANYKKLDKHALEPET
jgi:hypothetical protein